MAMPVPGPDGSPIHPKDLHAAERRMLDQVHREEAPGVLMPEGNLEAARAAVERQNGREVTEDEAAAYRLAPENMLDWLEDRTTPEDGKVLDRWENHLDWLDVNERQPDTLVEDRMSHDHEHDRR